MDVTESGISTDTNSGHELKATSGISVKVVTPNATVKLTRLLVVILESAAVNAGRVNAVGAMSITSPDVKVTLTVGGGVSVIVTLPLLRSIVTFGSS